MTFPYQVPFLLLIISMEDTMIAYHLNLTSNSLLVADVELMTRFPTKDVLCKESINAGVHVAIVVCLAVISVNAMGCKNPHGKRPLIQTGIKWQRDTYPSISFKSAECIESKGQIVKKGKRTTFEFFLFHQIYST